MPFNHAAYTWKSVSEARCMKEKLFSPLTFCLPQAFLLMTQMLNFISYPEVFHHVALI